MYSRHTIYVNTANTTYNKALIIWLRPQHLLQRLWKSLSELCQQLCEGEAISGCKPLLQPILQDISIPSGGNIITVQLKIQTTKKAL